MTPLHRARRCMCLACCFCGAVQAAPVPTRDQNPFVALFGLPTPLPARWSHDPWSLAIDLNVGSSAFIQETRQERFVADAETRELRVTVGRELGERWVVRLELPYRYVGGGTLDNSVERFHHSLGLDNGDRDSLRDDRLQLTYVRAGRVLFDQRSSTQGVADLVLSGGYQWLGTQQSAASLWVSVKAPTGTPSKLTGSGAADFTVAVAAEHALTPRWNVFGQWAVSRLGKGDVLPELQREALPSAFVGGTYRANSRLELQLQLDYHGSVFQSPALDYLGPALLLTLGGAYQFDDGWRLAFGLSEDLDVAAAPDVTLSLRLQRGF